MREARRQKGIPTVDVPRICILDPDGDLVRRLRSTGQAKPFESWACYHTQLDAFRLSGETVGIVGCAVGAPFAVLVAEQLFASGCRLLISLTSAGQIDPAGAPPYFVVIDRALRDEGTSYHYAAPTTFAEADPVFVAAAIAALQAVDLQAYVGASWTTDAPVESFAGVANPLSLRQLAAGERVVDVGSGAGFDSFVAAQQVGAGGRVIGVDMTEEMLRKARAKATSLKLDHVEFREGLAERLPVEDGWADVVISNGVINLCADKRTVFGEIIAY